MIYGYIRVSTDTQTVENQKMAIQEYANYHRMENVQFTAETISGIKQPDKRKLGQLLDVVSKGDTIIVTELSRLGRTINSMADEFNVSWVTMYNFVTVNIHVKPLPPLKKEPKRHGHPTKRELDYFKKHSVINPQ